MLYFKVTNEDMQSLYSMELGVLSVQYKLKEYVRAPIEGLLCYDFNGITDSFSKHAHFGEYTHSDELSGRRRLWLCECKDPVFHDEYKILPLSSVGRTYNIVWGKLVQVRRAIRWESTPRVVLASAIKLVKEIKLDELNEMYRTYKSGEAIYEHRILES